jgi:hypothetical protein
MIKADLSPRALFRELEPDNRIDPSIPAANAPSLGDQLVRHEFNMPANDVVDELYDRNVNLIVSAAAPATELYRGDRVAFQFERTASRLIEMQSEEYLAREHRP